MDQFLQFLQDLIATNGAAEIIALLIVLIMVVTVFLFVWKVFIPLVARRGADGLLAINPDRVDKLLEALNVTIDLLRDQGVAFQKTQTVLNSAIVEQQKIEQERVDLHRRNLEMQGENLAKLNTSVSQVSQNISALDSIIQTIEKRRVEQADPYIAKFDGLFKAGERAPVEHAEILEAVKTVGKNVVELKEKCNEVKT